MDLPFQARAPSRMLKKTEESSALREFMELEEETTKLSDRVSIPAHVSNYWNPSQLETNYNKLEIEYTNLRTWMYDSITKEKDEASRSHANADRAFQKLMRLEEDNVHVTSPAEKSGNLQQVKNDYDELEQKYHFLRRCMYEYITNLRKESARNYVNDKHNEQGGSSPRNALLRENAELRNKLEEKKNELDRAEERAETLKAEIVYYKTIRDATRNQSHNDNQSRNQNQSHQSQRQKLDSVPNRIEEIQEQLHEKEKIHAKLQKESNQYVNSLIEQHRLESSELKQKLDSVPKRIEKIQERLHKKEKEHAALQKMSKQYVDYLIEKHRHESSELSLKIERLEEKCMQHDSERIIKLRENEEDINCGTCPDLEALEKLCKEIDELLIDPAQVDLTKDYLFNWRKTILKAVSRCLTEMYKEEHKLGEYYDLFLSDFHRTTGTTSSFASTTKIESVVESSFTEKSTEGSAKTNEEKSSETKQDEKFLRSHLRKQSRAALLKT